MYQNNAATELGYLQQAIQEDWIVLQGTKILSSGSNRKSAVILQLFHPKRLLSKDVRFERTPMFDQFIANQHVPGLTLAE